MPERRVSAAQEFDADFMVPPPNNLAAPTSVSLPCQMQRETFREIVNVADRQACAGLGYVDQRAPLENRRHFLDPNDLVGRSSRVLPPIEETHVHMPAVALNIFMEACSYTSKTNANC
jgi:hypothetical protein